MSTLVDRRLLETIASGLPSADRRDKRIAELEAALREARSMLNACSLDEPDAEYEASWRRGLEKIDAALKG